MRTPKLWAGVTGRHCLLTTGGLIGVRRHRRTHSPANKESPGLVGSGAYVYMNREAIKQQAVDAAKAEIGNMMGGALGSALLSGPADSELPDPAQMVPSSLPSFGM